MRETKTIEFKEAISNTFLKTVSAFSNYEGGEIFFGIDDAGNIKGLADARQAFLLLILRNQQAQKWAYALT